MRPLSIALSALLLSACSAAPPADDAGEDEDVGAASAALHEAGEVVVSTIDMADNELVLLDAATDRKIPIQLDELPGWPGGMPIHAVINDEKDLALVTLGGSATEPAGIVAVQLRNADWDYLTVQASIKKAMITDGPGARSSFPAVRQVDPRQPIAGWTQPESTQIHAPTLLPHSKYAYFTTWTDNRIRIVDMNALRLASPADPVVLGDLSRQTHGIYFNPSGTLGLGTGYYYDHGEIDVYEVNRGTGGLRHGGAVQLGTGQAYAAFTHHVRWIDDNRAVAGTMQLGPTSLTPYGAEVIGPSVWLVDARQKKAKKILGTAASPDQPGVYRSASDVMLVGHKLYVGEEDSLGATFGRDGSLAVYDATDIEHPVFLKRLRPGRGLPAGFTLGHAMSVTPGGEYIYLESYASGYLLKIDTQLDKVVRVFDESDGLTTPHGAFISGSSH